MKTTKINLYLIATILTLSVSSFAISFWLIDEILESTVRLGINPKTGELLSEYQKSLKQLKNFNPEQEQAYKQRFFEIQDLLEVYRKPEELRKIIKHSYLTYFLIIFISILLLSIVAAILLSRKVSDSYRKLLKNNLDKSRRLQDLENIQNWQNIAASLAHEIKNPLTPIEMMVSNLNNAYHSLTPERFDKKLNQTQHIILEEVDRLKKMVKHFSQFSKLPEAKLQPIEFESYIPELVDELSEVWPTTRWDYSFSETNKPTAINLDKALFKQCLINLVNNAVEANPSSEQIKIKLDIYNSNDDSLILIFSNQGKTISEADHANIFQVGYSSKNNKNNQGLGLSIVKKIILEHFGTIEPVGFKQGAAFMIKLPINQQVQASHDK